jgi:hypothetical protein
LVGVRKCFQKCLHLGFGTTWHLVVLCAKTTN